jgi:hypothetical protein
MLFWLADVPGEQVADAVDGVVGDAGEHVAEVGFGIEAVELGGLDQGIEGGGAFAAGVGAGEEIVLPAEGQRPDLPFGGVVVDLQATVVEVAAERGPVVAGVADGSGQLALPRQLRQHGVEGGGELVDQRCGFFLADQAAPLGGRYSFYAHQTAAVTTFRAAGARGISLLRLSGANYLRSHAGHYSRGSCMKSGSKLVFQTKKASCVVVLHGKIFW